MLTERASISVNTIYKTSGYKTRIAFTKEKKNQTAYFIITRSDSRNYEIFSHNEMRSHNLIREELCSAIKTLNVLKENSFFKFLSNDCFSFLKGFWRGLRPKFSSILFGDCARGKIRIEKHFAMA